MTERNDAAMNDPPKTPTTSTSGSTTGDGRLTLIVVRHGEREDYAQRALGNNWVRDNPDQQPWNPPLTTKGVRDATQLGAALQRTILPDLEIPPIGAVYSSPLLRCRQTAAGIVRGSNDKTLNVKVELGLSESMSENWYRSWSLPGTNGTWGYQKQEIPHLDPVRDGMDPRVMEPAETLLDWKAADTDNHSWEQELMDHQHVPQTNLGGDYSFRPSGPPNLETGSLQRKRIDDMTSMLQQKYRGQTKTIVLVSHGGIVSQFFANLTGHSKKQHGDGHYCCFSIYQSDNSNDGAGDDDEGEEKPAWTPLVVNKLLWKYEKKHEFDDCPQRE